jgi:hypothetical protein
MLEGRISRDIKIAKWKKKAHNNELFQLSGVIEIFIQ